MTTILNLDHRVTIRDLARAARALRMRPSELLRVLDAALSCEVAR